MARGDGAGGPDLLNGFSAGLDKLAGKDIDATQALVNPGRLDTNQTAGQLRESIAERQAALAALEAQHRPDIANLDLRKQWGLVRGELDILERRLKGMQDAGLDFTGKLADPIQDLLGRGFTEGAEAAGKAWSMFGDIASSTVKEVGKQLDAFDSFLSKAESDAKDLMAAFKVREGQMTPLETFKRDTAELQRLFDTGFLKDEDFNRALFDARRDLEQFVGLDGAAPGRVSGARRGSAEAFERVAAFQDQGQQSVPRKLDDLIAIAEKQLKLEQDAQRKNRSEFDQISTVDTKP